MFAFIPLAITLNDWSVKHLGRNWKRLQQTVYIAAIGTLVHWIFVHNNIGPALAHFVPLAVLELYRVGKSMNSNRAQSSLVKNRRQIETRNK